MHFGRKSVIINSVKRDNQKEKNFQKKIKKLLTNLKKFVIIIIQGKERKQNLRKENEKKIKKVLDKLPNLCYNNNVNKTNLVQIRKDWY